MKWNIEKALSLLLNWFEDHMNFTFCETPVLFFDHFET